MNHKSVFIVGGFLDGSWVELPADETMYAVDEWGDCDHYSRSVIYTTRKLTLESEDGSGVVENLRIAVPHNASNAEALRELTRHYRPG